MEDYSEERTRIAYGNLILTAVGGFLGRGYAPCIPKKGAENINEKKPQDEKKRKRQNQIIIRFSDEELESLNEVIDQSRMSRTEFFIKLMKNGNIIIISDLQAICIELKKQGVNLNQALRFAYQVGDIENLKKTIDKCNDLYDKTEELCLATESKSKKAKKTIKEKR